MTKRKDANPATADGSDLQDVNAEMNHLASAAEQGFEHSAQTHLADLIDASTRGVLILSPYRPREVKAGKTYPVMTGYLDTRAARVQVAAFKHVTEHGREFLSLSIGAKGQHHIGGAVFRHETQDDANGLWNLTPGKDHERFGVIAKTVLKAGTENQYDTVFQLRFYGKRRLSATGIPYIKAQVYPERKDMPVSDAAMAGCF